MIELVDVHKSFDGNEVLKGVSAVLEEGKTNLIIGQSGSGKTVLMKSVIGLHRIDSGKILYDGRDLPSMRFKQVKSLRREMGMLFQGGALFDFMTVEQNVEFPLTMFSNLIKIERERRVRECLSRVNLKESCFRLHPSEISGGMQKRVAIARAIVLNPRYLFCDEPNSGLDPYSSLIIDRLIHEITEEYKMVTVINTHDMNSVMEIGDNIVFINKGTKEWQGSSQQLLDSGNALLDDFVFASDLFKKVKQAARLQQ
ncbi:MAG: ATP-binding cassette domain-containing protein [Paludibacteraceae bacterium]|jgi:phospholipid/cholesterol/gamma-HCH transport system ATP-binding protein|nr:ATP-binding cassette domain-containing protein [Paludibacteraceae bacterium]